MAIFSPDPERDEDREDVEHFIRCTAAREFTPKPVSQALPKLTIEAQADLLRRILCEAQTEIDLFDESAFAGKGVLVIDGAVFLSENDIALVYLLLSTARDDTATATANDTARDDTTTPPRLI